jgi:fucose 4-O-acetylase-like acetyltransferase
MRYNLPLWFLPCLFSTEILAYGIAVARKKYGSYIYYCAIAVSVLCTIFVKLYLPWHIETAFAMLFWFLLGMVVREQKISLVSAKKSQLLLAAVLLIAVGAGLTLLNTHNVSVRRDIYGLYWNYYIL